MQPATSRVGKKMNTWLFITLPLLALFYPSWRKRHLIKRWRRTLKLDHHALNFERLFTDVNGFALSKEARLSGDAMEYTYGEIDFISFIALLSRVKPDPNTVFYDVGSGVGKAVFACAMVFDVRKSCGIELFRNLHETALKKQSQLATHSFYKQKANTICFINDDFLNTDMRDATLIFINATAFFGETWVTLNQQLDNLNTGTRVITASKKLLSPSFIILETIPVQMSWGVVLTYIQQRR